MATLVLTSFSLLLPVFFSSLSLLLCSAFLFLFLYSQLTNRNSFCSLCFISTPSVIFSFFLMLPLSFSYCLPLRGDDEGDGDESVLCWLSSRPCLCIFFCFRQCSSALFFPFVSLLFYALFFSLFLPFSCRLLLGH